jgi:hypothetical protein
MRYLLALAILIVTLPATQSAQSVQTFTGVITDDMCGRDGHARMRMGPTDADCTKACVLAHGASFVLDDGKDVYILSDQKAAEPLAAQKVTVRGTLDAATKTIRVESMTAAG